ncbi:hypothetical protein ACWDV4_20515 [Micromonospora sp. NPDC003197]
MGDEWLVDKDIEVDIQQLQDFAEHIKKELELNFQPSFENGIRPMLTTQAPFGAGGLEEGRFFRGRHDESRAAVSQMLGEAMRGLTALSVAATSIAAEYLTGDALSQATNDDVFNAFSGVDGQQTLNDYWGDNEGEEQDPQNLVPEGADDPDAYFGENGNGGSTPGDTPAMYQETTIAEGKPGEYTIEGDDENMHDPNYGMPEYEH